MSIYIEIGNAVSYHTVLGTSLNAVWIRFHHTLVLSDLLTRDIVEHITKEIRSFPWVTNSDKFFRRREEPGSTVLTSIIFLFGLQPGIV